mmetsp:Transcript_30933/g.71295  ORF Transcript_30933/g.71295 Transcript_30933/m.71295 type:complete len:227 (-) Transcript_30933:1085-1765(-)
MAGRAGPARQDDAAVSVSVSVSVSHRVALRVREETLAAEHHTISSGFGVAKVTHSPPKSVELIVATAALSNLSCQGLHTCCKACHLGLESSLLESRLLLEQPCVLLPFRSLLGECRPDSEQLLLQLHNEGLALLELGTQLCLGRGCQLVLMLGVCSTLCECLFAHELRRNHLSLEFRRRRCSHLLHLDQFSLCELSSFSPFIRATRHRCKLLTRGVHMCLVSLLQL